MTDPIQYLTTTRAISYAPEYNSTTDSAWVADNIDICNRQIVNDTISTWLSPPTDDTTTSWQAFSDAALQWFIYLWNQKIGNKIKSDAGLASYNSALDALKKLGGSSVTTNRRPAIISGQDPRDLKIVLPSQADIYAFDNYA